MGMVKTRRVSRRSRNLLVDPMCHRRDILFMFNDHVLHLCIKSDGRRLVHSIYYRETKARVDIEEGWGKHR